MKAAIWTEYGPLEVLQIKDVERPTAVDDRVLIKVYSASINSWDYELLKGKGHINLGGHLRPPHRILGCDVAGIVEEVGKDVTKFSPGDEVFGDICRDGWGGYAEYVSARERSLSKMAKELTFEQAAAIPQASCLALQGLRDMGRIGPGQRVLINGAGGGVGSFAVQMARSYGAEVTGVDRSEKLDKLLSIGADNVIDHTKEDFTRNGREYDLIIDVVSHRSLFDYKRSLAPRGRCVLIGGSGGAILQSIVLGPWALGGRKVRLLFYRPDPKDVDMVSDMVLDGKVRPIIDRTFTLDEIVDAFRHYSDGKFIGKVVVKVR